MGGGGGGWTLSCTCTAIRPRNIAIPKVGPLVRQDNDADGSKDSRET